jgi:hypothetical protein
VSVSLPEEAMQLTFDFDGFTRRTAALLDRRSFLGGVGGALLTAGSLSLAGEAKEKKNKKKCTRRAKACRQEFLENCEDFDVEETGACRNAINRCCTKAAKCTVTSLDKLFDQCFDVLCDFKRTC